MPNHLTKKKQKNHKNFNKNSLKFAIFPIFRKKPYFLVENSAHTYTQHIRAYAHMCAPHLRVYIAHTCILSTYAHHTYIAHTCIRTYVHTCAYLRVNIFISTKRHK